MLTKHGMMKLNLNLLFCLLVIIGISFSLTNCSIQHKKNSNNTLLKKWSYTTFEGKATGNYNDAFNEQSFNVNFRITKNKYIWLSITGPLSIEGARILMMPDSVIIIDRLNKKIYSGSFANFQNKYKIPITFDEIQQTIVGDISNGLNTENCALKEDYQICTLKNDLTIATFYLNPKNYTLDKMRVKDKYSIRELTINFASYQIINGKQFSLIKNFEISNQQEMVKLQLEFSKAEFDKPLEYNFTIPESYEKIHF